MRARIVVGRLLVPATLAAIALVAVGFTGASASSSPKATRASAARRLGAGNARVQQNPSPALGDLLTYDYGNLRSGEDMVDPAIKNLSASPAWDDHSLDGTVYGEPLVYDGRVYVATENDSVYAIAAHSGQVVWHLHIGTAVSRSVVDSAPTLGSGCGDIDPLGITGTPVIDPANEEIFVAEETELPGQTGWQGIRHWLVAISLTTPHELWQRDVDPPHPNTPNHYYIAAEQQRPALTVANGRLYVAFGGLYGDCGQYHGYVVGLPESGIGPLKSYQVPTQREGAIWETDGAVVSPDGDLYVATGNGSSNTTFDEGNSVVELSPTLKRIGYWAPSDWVDLNEHDWDLGSAGPINVPGTSLLFEAGKPSSNNDYGFLLHEGHLRGVGHGAYAGLACQSGGDYGADASDVVGSADLHLRRLWGRDRGLPGHTLADGVPLRLVPVHWEPERLAHRRWGPGMGPRLEQGDPVRHEPDERPRRGPAAHRSDRAFRGPRCRRQDALRAHFGRRRGLPHFRLTAQAPQPSATAAATSDAQLGLCQGLPAVKATAASGVATRKLKLSSM